MTSDPATLLCPTCGKPVEIEQYLIEDSIDQVAYNVDLAAHAGCNQTRLQAAVRRSLKAPKVKTPKATRSQAVRNKRAGRSFEKKLARLLHANASIALTGDVDLDGGWWVGQAKHWAPAALGASMRAALAQFRRTERAGKANYLFVGIHEPGKADEVWVIQRLDQHIERVGLGDFEPKGIMR